MILEIGYTEEPAAVSFPQFQSWVQSGHAYPLHYLVDHRADMRADLRSYFPAFQSALVCLFSYRDIKAYLHQHPEVYEHPEGDGAKVAGYALGFQGEDYHYVMGRELNALGKKLQQENSHLNLEFKLSTDIHPVLERDLAYRAGLGWIGRNSMLIHPKWGSYFMIGAILLSEKLPSFTTSNTKGKIVDHCGNCRACIDACPTSAISEQRTLIASRCISTFTIEMNKEDAVPPQGYLENSQREIFGCDICQDICPWNRKTLKGKFSLDVLGMQTPLWQQVTNFFWKRSLTEMANDLDVIGQNEFRKIWKQTPFARPGKRGLLKNLKLFLKK